MSWRGGKGRKVNSDTGFSKEMQCDDNIIAKIMVIFQKFSVFMVSKKDIFKCEKVKLCLGFKFILRDE